MISSPRTIVPLDVQSLERRVTSNPTSPLFARLARHYMDADRIEEAQDLCEKGIRHYPEYATAHLLLGTCYLRLGRFVDAKRELGEALNLQPRCEVARELLREATSHENTLAEDQRPPTTRGELQEEVSQAETGVSGLSTEDGIGSAGKILDDPAGSEIVTATLAEIYASQGAYREAIRMYSLLTRRRPEEKERFDQRIQELEEKWRAFDSPPKG